jgi:hypothetical protein
MIATESREVVDWLMNESLYARDTVNSRCFSSTHQCTEVQTSTQIQKEQRNTEGDHFFPSAELHRK